MQMKAIVQYFLVVPFRMLYKVVLNLEAVDEIQSVTIQMKTTEQYFLDKSALWHSQAVIGG